MTSTMSQVSTTFQIDAAIPPSIPKLRKSSACRFRSKVPGNRVSLTLLLNCEQRRQELVTVEYLEKVIQYTSATMYVSVHLPIILQPQQLYTHHYEFVYYSVASRCRYYPLPAWTHLLSTGHRWVTLAGKCSHGEENCGSTLKLYPLRRSVETL